MPTDPEGEQTEGPTTSFRLAWVNNRPAVVSTIIGALTTEQLEANLRAGGLELSTEEYAVLDEASDLDASDYPYGELGVQQRRRNLDGG